MKKRIMTNLDRISELPNNLKVKVLLCLPIKEALKTSCLSSNWRYTWTYIPNLVFNAAAVTSTKASKLVKLVDVILLLHQVPIQKFTLELEYHHSHINDAIHRWMVRLSRKEIRELYVTYWKMPSSFFSTKSLTDVCLEKCVLKLPRSFDGLKLLKSLQLRACSISDKDLDKFLSSCSHLESLVLFDMGGLIVRICAPRLKHIHLGMYGLKHLHLITPMLVDATFYLSFTTKQDSYYLKLNDVFGALCNVERLEMGSRFMEFLADSGYMALPVKFTYLKKLVCSMDPSNQKEIDFAYCICQNAPSLETLEIFAEGIILPIGFFWEPALPRTLFGNLKLVEIICYQEYTVEFLLPLVKLLLATSPFLASVYLDVPGADENAMHLKNLLRFKRASKDVQIFVDTTQF